MFLTCGSPDLCVLLWWRLYTMCYVLRLKACSYSTMSTKCVYAKVARTQTKFTLTRRFHMSIEKKNPCSTPISLHIVGLFLINTGCLHFVDLSQNNFRKACKKKSSNLMMCWEQTLGSSKPVSKVRMLLHSQVVLEQGKTSLPAVEKKEDFLIPGEFISL